RVNAVLKMPDDAAFVQVNFGDRTTSGDKENAFGGLYMYKGLKHGYEPNPKDAKGPRWADVPAAGTWARGDVVYHNAPSAGGKLGWVCVTAGTPGTWKGFGTIDA